MKKDYVDIIMLAIASFAIATLIFAFTSCKSQEPIVQERIKEVEKIIHIRDTTVVTEPDTSSLRMLAECDSAGNVVIVALDEKEGKIIHLEAKVNQLMIDNRRLTELLLSCNTDSLEHVIQLQNEYISELENNQEKETVVERYTPPFLVWCTVLFWLIVLAFFVWIGIKIYLRTKGIK